MKVYIGTAREVGKRCIAWARENLPAGVELVDTPEDCELFISVLYPDILPREFLSKRPYSANFHPGILPDYRGAGSSSFAIINGETEAGVTLHFITPGIDDGPVIDIQKFPVFQNSTAEAVFRGMEILIESMFRLWFERLVTKNLFIKFHQENSDGKTYRRKDLEEAKDLTRFVRAFTFEGKENAYFINAHGEKVYLDYYDSAS